MGADALAQRRVQQVRRGVVGLGGVAGGILVQAGVQADEGWLAYLRARRADGPGDEEALPGYRLARLGVSISMAPGNMARQACM